MNTNQGNLPGTPSRKFGLDFNRGRPMETSSNTIGSFYSRVKSAKQHSGGTFGFIKQLPYLIIGTVTPPWCNIFVSLILAALAIAAIFIGALYLFECPAQPFIPIYLIVFGSFLLVAIALGVADFLGVMTLVVLFLIIWFIVGCFWIYGIDAPSFSTLSVALYCQRLLYTFAYWFNLAIGIIFLLILIFICALLCYGYLSDSTNN